MTRNRTITATITLDTSGYEAAMRRVVKAAAKASAAIDRMVTNLRFALDLPSLHQHHGRRNLAADGTWQSDLCAAWVHDSCPAPDHCDCTCHGGIRR